MPSIAQPGFSAQDKQAYNSILALDFTKTNQLLADTSTPSSRYLKHLQLTIAFLLTENPEVYDQLAENEENTLSEMEKLSAEPWTNFYLAEIKLRSAFVNLKMGNELSATWQLRQSYKLIVENQKQHPDFLPNYKTLGLVHILIGAVPEQYKWVTNLLGMDGDIQSGLQEIDKVIEGNGLFALEATILHAVINVYLLNNTQAGSEAVLTALKQNPDKALITYIATAIALKNSDAQQARVLYETQTTKSNPLMHYLGGEAYLQLGNYDKAEELLQSFLQQFQGQNFIKDAYYKLFLAMWLKGDQHKADEYLAKAKNSGQTLIEADKHASRMMRKKAYPNAAIMKIRLYTDGGAYTKAERLIAEVDTSTFTTSEHLEFIYRQARLKHKLNENESALVLYKSVVAQQQDKAYFAPNSCLQLGYLYRELNDQKNAKFWFEKALSYSGYEYENSIKNKAKAALAD